MWLTQWLGTLIRAQVFDVNNGNEDKADLVNPSNYDLENTQNLYFRLVFPSNTNLLATPATSHCLKKIESLKISILPNQVS